MNLTFSAGQWLSYQIKFSKRGELDRISICWVCWERRGEIFREELHKNKHKFEIFNDKKNVCIKMFFSVLNKNLKKEILTKNLVVFKQWDGVKYGKS